MDVNLIKIKEMYITEIYFIYCITKSNLLHTIVYVTKVVLKITKIFWQISTNRLCFISYPLLLIAFFLCNWNHSICISHTQ